MSDPLDRLEVELAAMKPTALPAGLAARIEREIAPPRGTWADRFLMTAMGLGALSACVIVVQIWQGCQISSITAPPGVAVDRQILAGAQIALIDPTN